METVDTIVTPSPASSEPANAGASGVQQTPTEPASQPVVIDAATHSKIVNDSLFPAEIQDPARPKEYSPEALADYENRVKGVERYRTFQRDVRDVVTKPVEIAPGVVHTFNSAKEVQEFAEFTKDKISNGLSGRDLVILHQHKQLIADAERRGERNYEKRVKTATTTAPVKTAPVVVPDNKPTASPNRTPTVKEIMQSKYPDAFQKFVKGE